MQNIVFVLLQAENGIQQTIMTSMRHVNVYNLEIRKLLAKKQQDGIILVPTAVTYRNGKNNYDKRHALKEKQTKRDIARSIKQY